MKFFRISLCILCCLSVSINSICQESFDISSSSALLSKGTKLKLTVEQTISTSTSKIGDLFIARLLYNAYTVDNKSIIIPKGSWVLGRIYALSKESIFSRAGSISIRLNYLVTPTGQIYPINANFDFKEGKVNSFGDINPQTNFKDKALLPTQTLLKSKKGKVLSAATLGIPIATTLIGGSAVAAVNKGDTAALHRGDTFYIYLTKNNLINKN